MKIAGINFCIKSLKDSNLFLKLDPNYIIESLNSSFFNLSKPSCLVKSLTFKKLTKHSNEFILIIGIAKIDGEFESHAWIERDERIILNFDPNIETFKAIYTYE